MNSTGECIWCNGEVYNGGTTCDDCIDAVVTGVDKYDIREVEND